VRSGLGKPLAGVLASRDARTERQVSDLCQIIAQGCQDEDVALRIWPEHVRAAGSAARCSDEPQWMRPELHIPNSTDISCRFH